VEIKIKMLSSNRWYRIKEAQMIFLEVEIYLELVVNNPNRMLEVGRTCLEEVLIFYVARVSHLKVPIY